MSNRPDLLSILIVSYRCPDLLAGCLESVYANPPSCDFEIVLVENGGDEPTALMVAERFGGVHMVDNDANLGFAGGNALAASHARGDVLLLLNPDTVVHAGAIDALLEALLSDERIWIAGAGLVDADGMPSTAWGDFPTLGWVLAKMAPWNRLGMTVRSRSRMGSTIEGVHGVMSVGWVSGASLLIRRTAWDELGGLYTGYFMYFEETDLCFRVHRAGGDVVLVPDARITHLEGGAIGRASARQRVWFADGLIRFMTRNSFPGAGILVRAWVLAINLALWLASWPVGIVSAYARSERPRYGALVRTALGMRVEFDTSGAPR